METFTRIWIWTIMVLLSSAEYDVDFLDCGSENTFIDSVYIDGCTSYPCRLKRGHSYNVVIIPEFLNPKIDTVDLNVRAIIRGALFNVKAKFKEPCGLPCPIREVMVQPEIPITLELNKSLIKGPAPLMVNATYRNGSIRKSRVCVQFDVCIE